MLNSKYGGDSVLSALYRVILGIWRTEQAPQDCKQDILLIIPKKRDASLCSNYCTIALQSIVGKAYANVLSARVSEWTIDNLPEEQCGFRPSRSTVGALFSLRLLCNGAWDKGQSLHICMLDLTKAFRAVDREDGLADLAQQRCIPKACCSHQGLSIHITRQSSAAGLTLPQLTQVMDSSKGVCLLQIGQLVACYLAVRPLNRKVTSMYHHYVRTRQAWNGKSTTLML